MSIALKLQAEHKLAIDFDALLKPTDAKKAKGDKVYDILSQLKTPTIVTTNYDQWLDDKRTVFIKPKDITVQNLEVPDSVFHIHGSVTDQANMVLTTLDYLNRYAGHNINGQIHQENPFLTFLERLFQLKNCNGVIRMDFILMVMIQKIKFKLMQELNMESVGVNNESSALCNLLNLCIFNDIMYR